MTSIINNLTTVQPSGITDHSVSSAANNVATVTIAQDAPAYTLDLSPEAQAALAKAESVIDTASQEVISAKVDKGIIPRPDISDKVYTGLVFNAATGELVGSVVENRKKLIEQFGDPLDYVMKRISNDLNDAMQALANVDKRIAIQKNSSSPYAAENLADAIVQKAEVIKSFTYTLKGIQLSNERLGISDYAEQVFSNLNGLYEKYLF